MKRIYCILLATFACALCRAQSETPKGDHYLFPEFNQGVVLLSNGKTDSKPLNYNALTQELLFDSYGKVLAVPKEQLDRIDSVFIKGRRFVILNDKFVELVHDSQWDLFVEHRCELKEKGKDAGYGGTSQTSAIDNPSSVRLGGMIYNLQLPDGFQTKRYVYYWLRRDDQVKELSSMKQLKKLYKQKDDLFDQYMKEHTVDFQDQGGVIQLIEHLESN